MSSRDFLWTLVSGVVLLLTCELLLAVDVVARGGLVVPLEPGQRLVDPAGLVEGVARWVAANMTPLCWVAYLLIADGALQCVRGAGGRGSRGSPIRVRPGRFLIAWLTSIPVWCFFDWVNFRFIHAWQYHGLPERFASRCVGYFVAFAAISPGMFLAAELYQRLGMRRLRSGVVRVGRVWQVASLCLGLAFLAYPFVVQAPIASLTLWVCLVFLLDPVNDWLGAPSMIGDWRAGRWGRTLSLMAGGATCGLCWEFWNYWALAKWTYHLPFLGAAENFRCFEMPWVGFLGFLPFALECWVVLNTIVLVLRALQLEVVEPLPDHDAVL